RLREVEGRQAARRRPSRSRSTTDAIGEYDRCVARRGNFCGGAATGPRDQLSITDQNFADHGDRRVGRGIVGGDDPSRVVEQVVAVVAPRERSHALELPYAAFNVAIRTTTQQRWNRCATITGRYAPAGGAAAGVTRPVAPARNPDLRPRAPSALPPAGGAFLATRPHGGGWRCGDRGARCPGGLAECERADPGGRRLGAGCRTLRQRDGGAHVPGSGALRHRVERRPRPVRYAGRAGRERALARPAGNPGPSRARRSALRDARGVARDARRHESRRARGVPQTRARLGEPAPRPERAGCFAPRTGAPAPAGRAEVRKPQRRANGGGGGAVLRHAREHPAQPHSHRAAADDGPRQRQRCPRPSARRVLAGSPGNRGSATAKGRWSASLASPASGRAASATSSPNGLAPRACAPTPPTPAPTA